MFDLQEQKNLFDTSNIEDIPFVALNGKYLEIFDILVNFFLTNYFAFFSVMQILQSTYCSDSNKSLALLLR